MVNRPLSLEWLEHMDFLLLLSVSAFYAEHYNKKISFSAHVWTKSKFLGLSIGVHNIGQGTVTLCDLNEEYIVTFPNGYGRLVAWRTRASVADELRK